MDYPDRFIRSRILDSLQGIGTGASLAVEPAFVPPCWDYGEPKPLDFARGKEDTMGGKAANLGGGGPDDMVQVQPRLLEQYAVEGEELARIKPQAAAMRALLEGLVGTARAYREGQSDAEGFEALLATVEGPVTELLYVNDAGKGMVCFSADKLLELARRVEEIDLDFPTEQVIGIFKTLADGQEPELGPGLESD